MSLKTWHQGVDWQKWKIEGCKDEYVFTLKGNSDYKVVCNFGKYRTLVYQLLYKKRNYTIVGNYNRYTLSKILGDWEQGKVYIQLHF